MKNKGFTLVELLAVVALVAIITIMGSYGIRGINNSINNNMYNNTVSLIERAAVNLGEDNIKTIEGRNCSSPSLNKCIDIKVSTLIARNYVTTRKKDKSGNKILVDDRKDEKDSCYILNDETVRIYIDSGKVYAELKRSNDCK